MAKNFILCQTGLLTIILPQSESKCQSERLLGPQAQFGAVNCGCHPNCGIGTILFVNKRTKQMLPLMQFLDLEQLMRDVTEITDGNMPREVALATSSTPSPSKSPTAMPASANAIMSPIGSPLTAWLWLAESCQPPRITREIS
mgnify:CR=1 FL=1